MRGANSLFASVLLPVYNGEKYLAEAIRSVLGQTFTRFELLLLDDGSTDASCELMQSFVAVDSRCRLFSWPNRGIVATLNAGLEHARGDFIFRMDADDICLPSRFEKQIEFLRDHPDHVALGSMVQWIDPEGMPLRVAVEQFSHDEIDARLLTGAHVLYHPAMCIRASALRKVGGYREGYKHSEDLDLFLRLAEIGKVANLREILLRYRQHFHSIGKQHTRLQWQSACTAIEEACARRGIGGVEDLLKGFVPPPSQALGELHQIWAWWALHSGNVATARKHAIRALALQPLSGRNWRLAACALRGH